MDKGVVAERGTHDELIRHDGVYKKLVLKQLEAGGTKSLNESEQGQQ